MITAKFYIRNERFEGFTISGHANAGRYGHDILCAGVSSAVMLTINTITDFLHADAVPKVFGNKAGIKINTASKETDAVVLSLEAHLKLLAKNGGGKITVIRRTYYKEGN